MIGICGPGEIRLVAGITGRRRRHVVVVRVALRAGNRGMRSRQRIVRVKGVVEGGVEPVDRRVAGTAVLRQGQLHVRRIVRADIVCAMAPVAGRRRSCKHVVDVAGSAGQSSVHPGQRVTGVLQVVELGAHPTIHGVACLACGREAGCSVIDNGRQEVLLMAGVTCRRQALELPAGSAFVALVALHQRMRSNQREAVLVVANRIQRNVPALNGVAAFTIGAKLPAMNIGVAIGAFGADILEDHAGMALGAADLLVHAAQRIARAVMIELRIGPDRLPTRIGMTVLAGNVQGSMRVRDLGLRTAHARTRIARWLLRRHAHQQ